MRHFSSGRIYIAGGFNGTEVLNSVEVYDAERNSWVLVANILSPRSGLCLIADEIYLYAIGGFNGHNRLHSGTPTSLCFLHSFMALISGERYNKDTLTWTPIGLMMTPRSNFAVVWLNEKIFALGGFNGSFIVE